MRNHLLSLISIVVLLAVTITSCQVPQHDTTLAQSQVEALPTVVTLPGSQQDYFQFAWDTFLALNSPAPGGQGVVWEGYKEAFDVFLEQPLSPALKYPTPWGADDLLPSDCKLPQKGQTRRVIRQVTKASGATDILDERMQAVGGIMLDQNEMLARYEVRMNKTMFDYLVNNKLFNGKVQATFGKPIDWPSGTMELKASWRELTASEQHDPTIEQQYYVTDAWLYNDPQTPDHWKVGRSAVCQLAKVALVGLHIVYKIDSNPLFVWMTFEHVNNLVSTHGRPASFNNASCPSHCQAPATGQTYKPGDACYNCVANCRDAFQYCEAGTKTQVVRHIPIPPAVKQFNQGMQKQLGQSKWANYQLVGVQYPQSILTYDPNTGERLLGNSTMETYNQSYSSCIGCHYFARTGNPLNSSDFSWFLRRAQKPANFMPSLGQALMHHVKTPAKTRGATSPTPTEVFAKVKHYQQWKTWPADQWNDFESALMQPNGQKGLSLPGENPHGNFIRIFVNDTGLKGARTGVFPPGSIIIKENLPCQYVLVGKPGLQEQCAPVKPQTGLAKLQTIAQSPIEWTIMLKMPAGYYPQGGNWYYLKGRLPIDHNPQIVDVAGKVEVCASCHSPVSDPENFMFTYNKGQRPKIRSR